MQIFGYIIAIIVPIITGFCIVRCIAYRYKYEWIYLEYFWLAIPIGFWLVSYLLFISNRLLNLSFKFWIFLVIQILIILRILIYLVGMKKLSIKELIWKKIEFSEKIHVFKKYGKIIITGCLVVLWVQLWFMANNIVTTPTYTADAINNWNMKSEVFFENKDFVLDKDSRYFLGGQEGTRFYPLNICAQRVWLVLGFWEWNEQLANTQPFIFFLAGLLIMFSLIYIFSWSLVYSVIGSLLLASIPIMTIHGTGQYWDVTLAAGTMIAILYGFLFIRSKEKFYLIISLIGASLAIRTKNEWLVMVYGWYLLMMWLYYIISFHNDRVKVIKKVLLLLVPLWAMGFWVIFRLKMFGLWTGVYMWADNWSGSSVSDVFIAFMKNLFSQGNYNLLFPVFLLVSIFSIHKIWKDVSRYIYVYLIFILLAFILSPLYSNTIAIQFLAITGTSRFMVSMIIWPMLFATLYGIYNNVLANQYDEEKK